MDLPPMVEATKREDKAAKEQLERIAKSKHDFELAKKEATKFCDHFTVNAELGFRVQKKMKARTPKGFRGYVAIEGRIQAPFVLYTVAVGFFHPVSGVVACGFPVFQTANIEMAVKFAKDKQHGKNLMGLVKVL